MRLAEWDSYEDYRRAQIQTHDKKAGTRWVKSTELRIIVSILVQHLTLQRVTRGICHGVRTGAEVSFLTDFLGLKKGNIIGTDIAPRLEKETYQHDFHDERKEWLEIFDFVYSNALDHSYDPSLAIKRWADQLRVGGIMLLHWSSIHNKALKGADCFIATIEEYKELIKTENSLQFVESIETIQKRSHESTARQILVGRKLKTEEKEMTNAQTSI